MIKLIDNIKSYTSKKSIDPFQRKSFLNIIRFFVIMIILTLIARGTAGAIMPKISLIKVSAETIADKIDIVGQLELSNQMAVEAYPDIKINDILVEIGEKVEEGDPLLEYDKNEVDHLVKTEIAEISKLQVQYNQLLKGDVIDTSEITNANDSLAHAVEDQETSSVNSDNTIAKANKEILNAKNDLADLEEQYNKDMNSKENAKKELNAAQQALETLQAKPEPDQATIDAAIAQIEETNATLVSLENQAELDRTEIETGKTTLLDAETELDRLKSEEPDNVTAIAVAEITVDNAKLTLAELEKNLVLNQEEIEQETKVLAESEATLIALQTLSTDLVKAQQRVDNAKATVNDYDGKQKSGENTIKQAKRTIEGTNEGLNDANFSAQQEATLQERGVASAIKSLDSANNSYLQSEEQLKDSQELNSADANILSLTLDEKNKQLKVLQQIQEADYLKLSTQSGILLNWNIEKREPSIEVAGIIIDESLGYQFIFHIEEDDLKKINHGMEIIIIQNYSEISAMIIAIGEQNTDETFTITAKVDDGDMREGSASAFINISEQEYEACVPSTALRQDDKGSFVYGVEERNTILGIQNIVYRIDVVIKESSNGVTAITGALYRGDSIISFSDKAINSGDRVRIDS